MNPKIVKLLHEGFSMDTLEKLNSKQLTALYEKVSKKETKEATTKTITSTTYSPDEAKGKSFQGTTTVKPDGSVEVTKEGEMTEDEEDSMNFEKGMRTQLPKQVGPSTNDGSNDYGDGLPAESNIQEKAVSKQQQKIMGLALSVKRGDTPKSKVSKQVQKMAKEMSKKELEDFASTKHKGLPKTVEEKDEVEKLEESILRIIENHLPPHTTKGELLNYIRRNK